MKLSERQIAAMTEYGIPGYMHGGLIRYYESRIEPGHFLSAVLKNDLMEALARADETNRYALHAYGMWLYNQAPAGSYGSPEAFKGWLTGTSEIAKYFDQKEAV